MVELLSLREAANRLDSLWSGSGHDDFGALLAVDVDRAGAGTPATQPLLPPALWPGAVVAVGSGTADPPLGADVYLTDAPDPPRPWVAAPTGLQTVANVIADHPRAACTLVQVMRLRSGDVARDLVAESLAYAALQGGVEHRSWLAAQPVRSAGPAGPALRLEREDDTLRITLNCPERRNAFGAVMRDELVDALQLALADPTLLAVELAGAGPSFCSGGDLAEFGSVSDTATAHHIRMSRSAGWWVHLVAPKLTARLQGACVGAGVELPAFAGHVVAAPDTTFLLPETGMGLIPGAGGTASIPRRIGPERTTWLALSGVVLDVGTALRWGLVDEITTGRTVDRPNRGSPPAEFADP